VYFGGGFYGLTVLWTLLANGIDALIVNLVLSQPGNVVAALLWFCYWPDGSDASVVIWVGTAYAGYLLGIHMAREGESLQRRSDMKSRIRLRRKIK